MAAAADTDSVNALISDEDIEGRGPSTKLGALIEDREWTDVISHLNTDSGRQEAAVCDEYDDGLPLHAACRNDPPLEVIVALIDSNPRGPAAADDEGRLPLHSACGCKPPPSKDVLSELLRVHPEGAFAADAEGQIPLTQACIEEAPLWLIRSLLDVHPAGARAVDGDGNLPIHWAFHSGPSAVDTTELLLSAYPEAASKRNSSGSLPVHRACTQNAPVPVVNMLLEEFSDGASSADEDGNLPIHLLCRKGSPFRDDAHGLPSYLDLPEGVVISPRNGSETAGTDPKNALDVMELLLKFHHDGASAANRFGELPLHRACSEEAPLELVHSLLKAYPPGACTRCGGGLGDSCQEKQSPLPLHLACSFDSPHGVVRALLKANPGGASEEDGQGRLPLHCAIRNNAPVETISALLEDYPEAASVGDQNGHGIDLVVGSGREGGRSELGALPLQVACVLGASLEVVKALDVANPKAARVENDMGEVPLHLACRYDAPISVVEFLIQSNPDSAKSPDRDGLIPIDYVQRVQVQKDTLTLDCIEEEDIVSNSEVVDEKLREVSFQSTSNP